MNKLVEAIAKRLIECHAITPPENLEGDNVEFWADGSVLQGHAETRVYAVLRFIDPEKDGWKLVPVEPTEEMTEASFIKLTTPKGNLIEFYASGKWEAMLAVSPDPSA